MLKRLLENLEHPLVLVIRYTQLVAAIIIFAFAALATFPDDGSKGIPMPVLHIIGNILLLLSAWVALFNKMPLRQILGFIIPYSVVIELMQGFTETRTVDHLDLVANFIGLFIAYGIILFLQKITHLEFQAES